MRVFHRRDPKAWLAAVALVSSALMPGPCRAWGADGHRLVAAYAQERLTPTASAAAERLLALEPGATFVSLSTWADETRAPATAAWHFVNFPREGGCHYDASRVCVQGNCVVGALERQLQMLASGGPDLQRLEALKYVLHFVGDVHQPLHAGFADDRGGNTFQLQDDGVGTNLHALWDFGLIERWPGGLPALRQAMEDLPATAASGPETPASWAEESCAIVQGAGFYPQGHVLGAGYAAQWNGLLLRRLTLAGRRLAAALNTALAGR